MSNGYIGIVDLVVFLVWLAFMFAVTYGMHIFYNWIGW